MKVVLTDNIKQVTDKLAENANEIRKNSPLLMWQALSILEAAIKQNIRIRSGLRVRSGTLLNSIQKDVTSSGETVKGSIGPENVPYAAIHEYGGTIPARRVEPRHTKALKWLGTGGKFFFSKGHDIPAVNIKARPYLEPALKDNAEIIREKFGLFIKQTMEK